MTGKLIGYTVQTTTKVWIALADTTGMLPFSKTVAPHLMSNCTRNVFEIMSRREDGDASKVQAKTRKEVSLSVQKKKKVAAEMWTSSVANDEALPYVNYLYLEHDHRALMNNSL